jgi:glutathione S-transferase
MPVDPNADIEISAFSWVPPFAQGLVRDLRIRWALEEIGRPYRVRYFDARTPRPADYFCEQPWGQVPVYRDNEVQLFESGAILIYLGLQDERLLPSEKAAQMRGISWVVAALNSVEPAVFPILMVDTFNRGEAWTEQARPKFLERLEGRLKGLSEALGDKQWLEDRFTIGDLTTVAVLRQLRGKNIVEKFPNIGALIERAEERPAFQRALAAQMAGFQKEGEAA